MARLEDIHALGAAKRVEAISNNPELVRCTFRGENGVTPEQARGTFLLQKLANILLPGVMPVAHSFGRDEKTGEYYMDVERIALDAKHLAFHDSNEQKYPARPPEHNRHELDYYGLRYSDEIQKMRDIGLTMDNEMGFPIDSSYGVNWTLAENKLKYLDMGRPWSDNTGSVFYSPIKLNNAIESLQDEEKLTTARALFDELQSLAAGRPKKKL